MSSLPPLPHVRIWFHRVRIGKIRLPDLIRRYRTRAPWMLLAVAALVTLPSPVPGAKGGPYAGAVSLMRPPTASNADIPALEIPALALRAYRVAESWASSFDPNCNLPWAVLAGIGKIESNHGRHLGDATRFSAIGDVTPTILGPALNGAPNTGTIHDTDGGRLDGDTIWDRAVGPMQFIPSTWQSLARDGNDDGIANPNNLFDAAVSAADYLCLSGGGTLADPTNLRRAVYAYNHSSAYVAAVLAWTNFYLEQEGEGALVQVQVPTGPSSLVSVGGVADPATPPILGGRPGSSNSPTTPGASRPQTTRAASTSPPTNSSTTTKPATTIEGCPESDGHDSSCQSGGDSGGGGTSGSGTSGTSGSGTGTSGTSGSGSGSGDSGSGSGDSGSSGSSGSGDGTSGSSSGDSGGSH